MAGDASPEEMHEMQVCHGNFGGHHAPKREDLSKLRV